MGKAFSLSRAEFITQEAYRVLKNLGFEILNIEDKEKESKESPTVDKKKQIFSTLFPIIVLLAFPIGHYSVPLNFIN